jgi:hypothetical protein
MTFKRLAAAVSLAAVAVCGTTIMALASDHDDGEADLKGRALNLTDHYTFKTGSDLAIVTYVSPRSLPGRQYYLSTNARYEQHITKVGAKTDAPTGQDDYVLRFEAGAPDASGVQPITLTLLKDGAVVGTHTGSSTSFANSQANTVTTNTATIGGITIKYFVGMRADSFTFDVQRFFQVRSFLASRFFGGTGGNGNADASLAPNCRGDSLFSEGSAGSDEDGVNLWNPPSCAPDFTKNYNVISIVADVPISQLGGGSIFDTWSTISVLQ